MDRRSFLKATLCSVAVALTGSVRGKCNSSKTVTAHVDPASGTGSDTTWAFVQDPMVNKYVRAYCREFISPGQMAFYVGPGPNDLMEVKAIPFKEYYVDR